MKIALFALLAALFLTSACSTVNTVERANPQSSPTLVNDKRVITDSTLNDYAYVASVNETKRGNLLMIQARIVNSTSALRSINYKFTWIDKNGMEVPSATAAWRTLVLEGGESGMVSAVAPNANACDFTLKLLPNKRD